MKVQTVNAARKPAGTCGHCGEPIDKGAGYRYIKPRFGPRRVRHTSCPSFRPSDLTSNDKLADLYAAQENVEDVVGAWDGAPENADDVVSALRDAKATAEDVAERYRDIQSNIEDGFGHATFQSDEAGENADACDEWGNALGLASDEIEGMVDDADDDFGANVETIANEALGELPL